jgi:hypothetical protein
MGRAPGYLELVKGFWPLAKSSQFGKGPANLRDVGMVGAKPGLVDRQGTLVQAAGAIEVALGVQEGAEVAEAIGGIGMVGAKLSLVDRQSSLQYVASGG